MAEVMPYFDRFDICEAYYVFEALWNVSGKIPGRERQVMGQLERMSFKPRFSLYGEAGLSENARAIYEQLVEKYFADL